MVRLRSSAPLMKRLGTLDQLVRERGSNNKDGWGYSRQPDDERLPPPPRHRGRRIWFVFR